MTIGPEQRNAEMRGEPYDIHSESASERRAKNYHAENIDLRGQLEMSRKATGAAQELLEAERTKNAALNDKLINAEDARTANSSAAVGHIGGIKELRKLLDTTLLLRTNDAATITDLQRRLREAEGQLRAQRDSSVLLRKWAVLEAENTELRRTLGMVGKYLDELKELVNDPANPNGKP